MLLTAAVQMAAQRDGCAARFPVERHNLRHISHPKSYQRHILRHILRPKANNVTFYVTFYTLKASPNNKSSC